MERRRTTSLRGGKKVTVTVRDTQGMRTSRDVDSSSAKGTLGNRLLEKMKGDFMHASIHPSSEDLAHPWEHHFQ